jgi:hypothetical protein
MSFADASRFSANHDVVLVGYRGVDGSVRLDCPEVESALNHSADFLDQKSLDAYSNAFRSCAKRLEANSPATHSPNGSTTSRRHGKPSATTRSTC